ncbi:glycosyl transferase (plasmid) [Fulvitalea axinellae]|uniref:Glycosyl transferase n=1 Tax=Fulvitalea axinellae TaxID=1182444 RepID=A0AAU9CK50_9BACT|nr:glycosyl transferase [Fulvitalea axinellae]
MKILHLGSERAWRGGEQQIAYLIEETRAKGIENYVATRRASALGDYCHKNGIPYIELPFASAISLRTAMGIANYCKQNSIDLIHVHSGKSHTLAVISQFFRNTPIILSRRVCFPVKNSASSRWKYNHSSIQRILCISEAIRTELKPVVKDHSKLLKVYSGIAPEKFQNVKFTGYNLRKRFDIPENHTIVGSVAALTAEKGIFTLLDATNKILEQHPETTLVLIGDGALRDELEEYAKELGVSENVRFTGFAKNVPEILPQLDIFVLASRSEGLGTSILDAFCCKVPAVASNTGGIPEMIEDGITGFLATVDDSEGFASQITKLIEDPELRQTLTKAATEKLKQFDRKVTAEKTIKIYQEVLDELKSNQ